MTIASSNNRDDYTGNGSTANYAYTFRIFNKNDIEVFVVDSSDGTENTLTIDVDYTVNGVGNSTGTINLVSAGQDWIDGSGYLDSGFTLAIVRSLDYTQPTEFRNQGTFYPDVHEDAMDRIVMLAQQLNEEDTRTVGFSKATNIGSFNTNLPAELATSGAGKLIVVNATGDGFDAGPTAGNIADAEANAVAAAASAAAAATSETNAATSETNAAASVSNIFGQNNEYISSNRQILNNEGGTCFVVDASGGAVTLTLPLISTINSTLPYAIAVKRDKADTSTNDIIISTYLAGLFDEIDENGTTSITMNGGRQAVILIPDTDKASDQWESLWLGGGAHNAQATTKGDISTHNANAPEVLAISSTNDDVLVVDSSKDTGMKWGPSIQKYINELGLTNFAEYSASAANSWEACAWNDNEQTIIAIAPSTTSGAMRSTDRGYTWTGQTIGNKSFVDLIYCTFTSEWIALASTGTTAVETTTGAGTWTARTTTSKTWQALAENDTNLIVAVNLDGSGGDGAMYSSDGHTWTDSTGCQDEVWYSIACNGTIFVAVGASGKISTTTDGDTWTARTSGTTNTLRAITYGGGKFWAIGTELLTSTDGITWTEVNSSVGFSTAYRELHYCDGVLIALMSNYVASSIDGGVTWKVKRITTSSMESCSYGSGRLVIVQSSGTNRVKVSQIVEGE